MSTTRQRVSTVGRARFELDRLELVDGERYELEGRWFGVRGRRFMRPTLTVVVDDQPVRLLADLADKPWPAEEAEPWRASFPYPLEGGELVEAELTVAPDVAIMLPLPGGRRPPQPEQPPSPHELRAVAEQERAVARIDELLEELGQAVREREEAARERDEALRQGDEIIRLRDEAVRERDALAAELEAVRRERAEALRARDDAIQVAEAAQAARDASVAERGAAITAGSRAETERDNAMAELQRAQAERDSALALRDHALAERDAALAAREDALVEKDALARSNADLSHQLSSHGAAMVMRRAVQTPPAFERPGSLLPRALVIIALLGILVALLIMLHVV